MWTSAHFAVGMLGGGVFITAALAVRPRWIPPLLPLAMTVGGIWACAPDLPRLWREDFPSLPLAALLGSRELEHSLHSIGDWFFFHASMDAYRNEHHTEYALHGLIAIIALYNAAALLAIATTWCARRRQIVGPTRRPACASD